MCGIVALFNTEIHKKLINSLKELQNRGYDSAGISYSDGSTITCIKHASTKKLKSCEGLSGFFVLKRHDHGHGDENDVHCGVGHANENPYQTSQ